MLIVWCWTLNAVAQQKLSGSRQSSAYTYVYRISPEETKRLYKSNMRRLTEQFLHTKIDSFLTDRQQPPSLQPGNYLFVKATGNRLVGELKTIDDLQIKLLRNDVDFNIVVHNRSGATIREAQVKAGRHTVPYDASLQLFRSRKAKPGLITVNHEGTVHFARLADQYRNYYSSKPTIFRKWIQGIGRIFKRDDPYRSYSFFHGRTTHEKSFRGYMVFNKPMYKPGDTVRLKAWVATAKGHPVNRPLLLRLVDNDLDTDTILTTITPYRPGGYETAFVVNDSLDVSLDAYYLLTLEELSSRKYDLGQYDGDLDEDEYALKRKVLMRGKFRYEEYQLGQVTFTARSDKKEHARGNQVAVYCKAVDENNLHVMDGRVEIVITPNAYSASRFGGQQVFLADTIWVYQQLLDAIGETKIIIPDSIFPHASFAYTINCRFLNSNNEQQRSTIAQQFTDQRQQLAFTQRRDSLQIEVLEAGRSVAANARLYAIAQQFDTLFSQPVQLPANIRLNPFVSEYVVATDSLSKTFTREVTGGALQFRSSRNTDSVTLEVINPRRLTFWYSLYAGRQLLQQGQADSLYFAEKVRTTKDYSVYVQYIDGNRTAADQHTISRDPRNLNIQVQQPDRIFPGQQASISIDVTDAQGQPVANADLTAYAFTNKFRKADLPLIPSWAPGYSGPKKRHSLTIIPHQRDSAAMKMNWLRWSREMLLDTIEYYKFMHPETIYTNTEVAPHGTTQIAPFVVMDGEMVPVQLLYIDEVPMFFNQAGVVQQYSFPVKPGKHSLRIRTHNSLLIVDSLYAAAGMKTIFSINASKGNHAIRQEKMPATLSKYEQVLWSRYMILVENSFGQRLATINDGVRIMPVNFTLSGYRSGGTFNRYGLHGANTWWQQQTIRPYHKSYVLVGPIATPAAIVQLHDRFTQPFEVEGNYLYRFTKGQTRLKQFPNNRFVFPATFNRSIPEPVFNDCILSGNDIDSLWREYLDYRSANEELFRNEYLNSASNGRLRIRSPRDKGNQPLFVKSIILFRYDDPDFARFYKGNADDLGYVTPGQYRLVFLLKNDAYFIQDSLLVRANGLNYVDAGAIVPLPKDSISTRISAAFNNYEHNDYESHSDDMDLIKSVFNSQYVDTATFNHLVIGRVTDKETGAPLAGVSIMIKGTAVGTVTDHAGNFQLRGPANGLLLASYIGYNTTSGRYTGKAIVEIKMMASQSDLSEVVVVGYGTRKKSLRIDHVTYGFKTEVGASISLRGVAGGVRVQGANSITASNTPLYMVDGKLVDSYDMSDLSAITSIDVLKGADATSIYGSRAANGVIVISTKKGKSPVIPTLEGFSPVPGNQLRTNFRDYAYWQPRLRTDHQGKASFTAAFPDDITSWRTLVIAMGSDKRTGIAEGNINAFKALSASLAIPTFAIAGDSMQVIGKTMHYGLDSVDVRRSFHINDRPVKEGAIGIRNAHIDSFALTIAAQDSVRFKYTIQQTDGNLDGEERSIPVFKAGVLQTKGLFAVLDQDSAFMVQADPSLGNLTIHAEAAVMPVLLDEIESLRNYEYGCNEQLASKLKALLLKRKVYKALNKDFKDERMIRDLVSKLGQNRWQGKFWGWWSNNDPIWWVSLHVTDALLKAEEQGFRISLDKRSMIDYLVMEFNRLSQDDRITAVQLMQRLDAKVEITRYIDSLDKYFRRADIGQQLQILALKQQAGIPIALDTFITRQRSTMMRNVYWGNEDNGLFDNPVRHTLAMYRLLKRAGNQDALLKKIQYYFLEKRRDGKWRNTYESSLILEAILPDLLGSEQATQSASLTIEGQRTTTVNTFPYTATFSAGEAVKIRKEKGMPVYFTAWQQSWNATPEKVAGDFEVTTAFTASGQPVTSLKAGQAVELTATVQVKADADYVMVEIPVPAGCSYASKAQSGLYGEVHREYFKNKVSLFCKSLPKGTYTFTVSLMPRYSGLYQLNPAKAEMMYFPVFFGREGMKKIPIQ